MDNSTKYISNRQFHNTQNLTRQRRFLRFQFQYAQSGAKIDGKIYGCKKVSAIFCNKIVSNKIVSNLCNIIVSNKNVSKFCNIIVSNKNISKFCKKFVSNKNVSYFCGKILCDILIWKTYLLYLAKWLKTLILPTVRQKLKN